MSSTYLVLTVRKVNPCSLSSSYCLRTKYRKYRHFHVALRANTSSLLQSSVLFLFKTPMVPWLVIKQMMSIILIFF